MFKWVRLSLLIHGFGFYLILINKLRFSKQYENFGTCTFFIRK